MAAENGAISALDLCVYERALAASYLITRARARLNYLIRKTESGVRALTLLPLHEGACVYIIVVTRRQRVKMHSIELIVRSKVDASRVKSIVLSGFLKDSNRSISALYNGNDDARSGMRTIFRSPCEELAISELSIKICLGWLHTPLRVF